MNYEQTMERLKEVGVTDLFGTKKEVKGLPEVLKEDEQIMFATSGLVGSNTWLIVCTNIRVLFIDKGMIYGVKQVEITHEKINSVSFKTGMVFGEIHIHHGSDQMLIKNVAKKTVKPMVDAINKEIENNKQQRNGNPSQAGVTSSADEIKKYKELFDMGAITEEEFTTKKKQLLGI